jgi:hypothetical protein
MKKWEYLLVSTGHVTSQDGGSETFWFVGGRSAVKSQAKFIWEILNRFGFEGWELVCMTGGTFVMKRALP